MKTLINVMIKYHVHSQGCEVWIQPMISECSIEDLCDGEFDTLGAAKKQALGRISGDRDDVQASCAQVYADTIKSLKEKWNL